MCDEDVESVARGRWRRWTVLLIESAGACVVAIAATLRIGGGDTVGGVVATSQAVGASDGVVAVSSRVLL